MNDETQLGDNAEGSEVSQVRPVEETHIDRSVPAEVAVSGAAAQPAGANDPVIDVTKPINDELARVFGDQIFDKTPPAVVVDDGSGQKFIVREKVSGRVVGKSYPYTTVREEFRVFNDVVAAGHVVQILNGRHPKLAHEVEVYV